jgi:hypothetical protein
MKPLPLTGPAERRDVAFEGARWLDRLTLWRPADPDHVTTGDIETAVVLLAGTFDLIASGNAWPARGARATPFAGRPMAVYLPKRTEFRTQHGQGEILLLSARQPAEPAPAEQREALSRKPLLQMAGSGKAFDPATGEWRPAETFPTSPESLPPRRFTRHEVGAVVIERVFAADYKASTLSLDEAVVPTGASLALAAIPQRPPADELALFVRAAGTARVRGAGGEVDVRGDAAFLVARATIDGVTVESIDGAVYVVLGYAGKT